MKISDFLSRSKWERTDLFHHIFRPLGFHYQLGFVDGELPQLGNWTEPVTRGIHRGGALDLGPPAAPFDSSFRHGF
jgi:hypothetical protein